VSDWDHRQLCSDGACVGVIGSDGTCKVCGRAAPNWGDERKRGLIDQPEDEADDDEDEDDEDGEYEDDDDYEDEDEAAAAAEAPSADWDQRRLCPDDACVGVIGPAGTCNVCGRVDPAWDNERSRGLRDPATAVLSDSTRPPKSITETKTGALYFDVEPGDTPPPDGWDDRKLCSDDACTGLIGEDGTCKVCGKRAA
jgi:hypothetical protein